MTRYTPLWLQAGSYAASVDRRLPGAIWPTAASSGCAVTVASAMTLNIASGFVAVPTQNNTGTTLCATDAVEQVTLTPAPPSGQNRIDIVTCHPRGADLDGGANNDFIFDVIAGVAAASPSAPAIPAGQVGLAQVMVPGGAASIVAGNITDIRPSGLVLPRGYVASGQGPATQTDYTTTATVFTVNFPVIIGRRYKISAYCLGSQQTSASWPVIQVGDDQGDSRYIAYTPASLAVNQTQVGATYLHFQASSTRSAQAVISAGNGGAGAFRIAANAASLLVEDIGGG